MRFVITGKIKPYVHRTHKGKYSARAEAYHVSQNAVRAQLKNQMQLAGWHTIPRKVPLRIRIDVTVPERLHGADATNIQKAVEDACQKTVFENDCWVDDIATRRQLGDDYVTVIEVEPL
jgi:Holliday junction resolvase RusA-like endonuclease